MSEAPAIYSNTQPTPKVFPLSAITDRVKEILRPACTKSVWVRAEINSGRETGGSFYCDLVEAGPDGKVAAKLKCSIWSHDLRRIRRKFEEQSLDLVLSDGTSVVLCCQLQFSAQYGISLKVVDADPIFALGDIEKRKQAILEGLRRDGLLDPNKRLSVPTIPRRIGLVTSKGSAAYHDFIQTLERSGYSFTVTLADSAVQGVNTEASVLKGLTALARLPLDLVVLIRGGGSKSDLSWFDNDPIARMIAGYHLPVWVGVGHEIDFGVCDAVANRTFKTPTAVSEELVARCVGAERYLDDSKERLKTLWLYQCDRNSTWIQRAEIGIRNGIRKHLDMARARLRETAMTPMVKVSGRLAKENGLLSEAAIKVRRSPLLLVERMSLQLDDRSQRMRARTDTALEWASRDILATEQRFHLDRLLQRLEREDERLSARLATVSSYDPEKQLQRGYALLRDASGRMITAAAGVQEGDHLVAQMHDGQIQVAVESIASRPRADEGPKEGEIG